MPLFLLLIFLSFSVGGNEMDTAILPWSERSENKLDRQKEFSQVPDNFRLIDQNGIMHSLYDYLDKKNVILIPYNQTCVLSKASHYIIDSATKSLDDRIQIIFLSPDVVRNSTDSAEKIIILNDYAQFVLKQYDIN